MNYVLKGRKIELESGRELSFKFKIHEAVEIGEVIVVCLEVPRNRKLAENVYAITLDGKLVWQVPKTPHATKDAYYVGIEKAAGLVRAFNYDGMVHELDPKTGRILKQYFGK